MIRDARLKRMKVGDSVLLSIGGALVEGTVKAIKVDLENSGGPNGIVETVEFDIPWRIGVPQATPGIPNVFLLDDASQPEDPGSDNPAMLNAGPRRIS